MINKQETMRTTQRDYAALLIRKHYVRTLGTKLHFTAIIEKLCARDKHLNFRSMHGISEHERRALATRRISVHSDRASLRGLLNNIICSFYRAPRYHPHLVTVVEMAVSIHRSGEERRYEEAEAMCDEALSSMRQSLPSDHADVATVLSVLAEVHQSQRAYSKAEKLIRLALQMRMRVLPPQHPDIATSLSSLALLHQAEGWHEKAQVLYTKALAIRRTALPRDHPDIATNLNNLAALHQSQNRLDEAEMMYVEGLGIMRRTLSMEHPDIAASINNLAGLHMAQGRYEKVEGMYIEALALRRKVLPADHPDIAESINNLAYLYFEKRLLDKAEPLLLEALTIGRKRLAAGHPNLVKYQRGLDMCRRVAQTGHASKPKLITLKKVGVNDPCPCGSKKKYVKLLTLCILCHILHSLLGVFWTYFWDIATMIHLKHGPLPSFLTILSSPLRYKKCCR